MRRDLDDAVVCAAGNRRPIRRRPAGRRGLRRVLLLVTVVALAGCAPAEPTATIAVPSAAPGTDVPAGLTASLVQYRRDQPRRFVEVKLDNGGDAPLDITLLDVTLPGFTSTGPADRTTNLKAGWRVDLPVPLGDPVCDASPEEGSASARLAVTGPDGQTARTMVPVDDDGLLARLHGFDCAVLRADDAADITLLSSWQRRGEGRDLTVAGRAAVVLEDPETVVEITDIAGGILFVAEPETITPPLPVRLDGGRATATIGFELRPARCDGHAIAEAKRLTTVTFVVSVDGADGVPVRRAPDDAGFDTLMSALHERCDAR